ncbi:ATP-binding cassette domain-containing protein [Arthrobacter sp. GCM10027362]|uniref:branched-chain amino acid ABC transporter ATP-binding protein/permease n=1 Tax=Arthrobacter sp. GCM10027362 TaxID=3273379 RepID=UPI003636491C
MLRAEQVLSGKGGTLAACGAALVLALALGVTLPAYWVFVGTSVLIAWISLIGLGVVTGTAGMMALCQLSFAAIGAWVLEYLLLEQKLSASLGLFAFPLALLAAGVAAALVGVVVGLPALRLRGVNLAVVTLGIAAAVDLTFQRTAFPDASSVERIERPFGIAFSNAGDRGYFLFTAVVALLVVLAVGRLQRGRWGAAWRAVAFSERGAAAVGQSVTRAKLTAFAVSAFAGGIAGGLTVGQIAQVNFTTFQTIGSLGLYVLSIVVGAHFLEMAFLGAVVFVLLPELLKRVGVPLDWSNVAFALLGVQALTMNSSLGADLRNKLVKRRRGRGLLHTDSRLAGLEPLPGELPQGSGKVLLDVRNLTVQFGALKALSDVSFHVREGSIMGLIGPNGAGKSTTIDALTGFLPQHEGRILLAGEPVQAVPPHRRAHLGLRRTFQQDRVPPTMSVGTYVRFVGGASAGQQEAAEALEFLGCPAPDAPLQMVDVGTRRLIEVAAALAARPKLLLLDEPAAGLSHEEHLRFAERLREIPGRFGVTLLVIEHDLDLVRSVCTEITVLNFGEVIAAGSSNEVFTNPEVLAAYMGEVETQ